MESVAQAKIEGMKTWVSSDKKINTASIFVENNLKNSKKTAGFGGEMGEGMSWGKASQEFKCKDSEIVKRVSHLPLPFIASIVIDSETDGKGGVVQVVMEIRPIPVEKPGQLEQQKKVA